MQTQISFVPSRSLCWYVCQSRELIITLYVDTTTTLPPLRFLSVGWQPNPMTPVRNPSKLLQYLRLCHTTAPESRNLHAYIKPWLSNIPLPDSSKRACDGSNQLGGREKIADYASVFQMVIKRSSQYSRGIFPGVLQEQRSVLAGVWVCRCGWLRQRRVGLAVLSKIEGGKSRGRRLSKWKRLSVMW